MEPLVVTDFQNAGRGRRGRILGIPFRNGCLYEPDLKAGYSSLVGLHADPGGRLAVHDGIKETTGLDTVIKWPNDIVGDGRKLCGILTR